MTLEVRVGAECRPGVGLVFDGAEAQEDFRSAQRTMSALATEGLFTQRGEAVHLLEFHFHSAADWQEFLARPKAGGVKADTDLLAATLAHRDGRIVATEKTGITVYDADHLPCLPRSAYPDTEN